MNPALLTTDQFESLRRLGTPRVSNAIETFGVRLRNEGYSDPSIRCLFPGLAPILGYAAALKVRSSDPPTKGSHYLEDTNWWDHIVSIPEPRVLVIQDVDPQPRAGAFLGEVHTSILQALRCVGAVTNGTVRDLAEVRTMGFQLFAAGASVSHAYVHVVETGGLVELGGLRIAPGDLLLADCHGVLSVPREIASRIPEAAARIVAEERQILALCRSEKFSIEKLRALVEDLRTVIR
jgi:4-hydroxy-4-methyl-2-oxoglutarate aldolase